MTSEKETEKSVNREDSIPLRQMKALLGAYEDLKTWLEWLPYYKPGDGQPECHHFCKEIVIFNSTVRLDYGYHAHHQGDIAVETLKGIKERIGNSVVFIHWEHNRRDLPWNKPYD